MTTNEPLLVQAVYSFKGKNNDEVKLFVEIIELVLIYVILIFLLGTAYLILVYIFMNYQ